MDNGENNDITWVYTEKEKKVVDFDDEYCDAANQNFYFCLIGRFMAEEPINARSMRNTFRKLWAAGETVNMLEVDHNTFLFCFPDEESRDRVLAGGPWVFNRRILLLQLWNIGDPLRNVKMEHYDVWVQVLNLPIQLTNEDSGRKVVSEIGEIIDSDYFIHSEPEFGNFVRIRVRLSITEPLPRGIHVRIRGEVFEYLLERVATKVKGWKEKYLSVAGKEILIKSVVQSVPSYAMSCFLLPKGTSSKFEQQSREFWWGSENNSGINWLAWDNMKKSKIKGGVGFRDMEAFNKALLAKQCWRLITKPHSLVARIFKAKYHKDDELIKAELGREPSYAWRSLVAGLEVLRKGIIKKIGNGGDTDFFYDPWIDRPGSFCAYSPKPPLANTLVRDFVIDGNWDVNKLTLLLWPVDLNDVLRMAVPQVQSSNPDLWSWHFEDNGCYTVKSGYKVAVGEMEVQGPQARASRHEDFSWMKNIWKLKVPSKIRFFLWRIARNILPTRLNLKRRQVIKEEGCAYCEASESSYHALMECSSATRLWNQHLQISTTRLTCQEKRTGQWFGTLFTGLNQEDRILFAAGLWTLWTARNEKIFKNKSYSNDQIFTRERNLLLEMTLGNSGRSKAATEANTDQPSTTEMTNQATNNTEEQMEPQQADSNNSYTLQFDGAWRYSRRIAGGGAILLNNTGDIVSALAKNFTWGNRAKEIEALALEMGVDLAIEKDIKHLTIEGDAEILLNQISGRNDENNEDRSTVKDIIDRIRTKSSFFTSVHWNWVPRDRNFRAHKLAAVGLTLDTQKQWETDFPVWLAPFDESVGSGS